MAWIDVVARGLKMARHNRSVTSFGFLMTYFGVVAAIAGGREMLAEMEPNKNLEPAGAAEQPEDELVRYGRFDPSSGAQSQKTPESPLGGNSHDFEVRKLLQEGDNAKKFFDAELEAKRSMMRQIEEGIRARWA